MLSVQMMENLNHLSQNAAALGNCLYSDIKQYNLTGSADDRSGITSFIVCSGKACIPITNNYINWETSLPLAEASTNPITRLHRR